MPRIFIAALFGALVLAGAYVSVVFADQVYHTERLEFALTAAGATDSHPELRHGDVVNIHPNGPVNGALERYMINGAKPDTSYDVVLDVFSGGCGGGPLFTVTTTTLQTNGAGNAHGQGFFAPEDLAPLSGATVGAQWTLRAADGVDAYQTPCTIVNID